MELVADFGGRNVQFLLLGFGSILPRFRWRDLLRKPEDFDRSRVRSGREVPGVSQISNLRVSDSDWASYLQFFGLWVRGETVYFGEVGMDKVPGTCTKISFNLR